MYYVVISSGKLWKVLRRDIVRFEFEKDYFSSRVEDVFEGFKIDGGRLVRRLL